LEVVLYFFSVHWTIVTEQSFEPTSVLRQPLKYWI